MIQLSITVASLIVASFIIFNQVDCNRSVTIVLNKETVMEAGPAGQPLTSYYLNTNIGTPAKPFKMMLDINAKEVWIPHSLTLSFMYYRLHYGSGYAKKASKTSTKEDREFSIDYQGCTLTGKAYEDLMEFRNVTNTQQPVSFRQRFLAISSASNGLLSDYPTDGVLSLNPAILSDTGTRSFLVNMNQAQLISELKFSLYLDNDLNSPIGGELTLGGINATKLIGTVYYHTVANFHDRWELRLQNVMLGGQVVSCHQMSCTGILSTGVNDLYGPEEDVRKIMSLLNVSKKQELLREKENKNYNEIHEIECLRITELPLITINIEGISYTIPPASYIKKKVDGKIFKTSTCYVTIFANKANNQWILGTNFLSNYYTVFDLNRRQVGFAARK